MPKSLYLLVVELYLQSREGSVQAYREGVARGLRPGQAFFNALSDFDRERVVNTEIDPFYATHETAVSDAIEWLLSTE